MVKPGPLVPMIASRSSLTIVGLFGAIFLSGCKPAANVPAMSNRTIEVNMGVVEQGDVAKYSQFFPDTWGTELKHLESSCECIKIQLKRTDGGRLLATYVIDSREEPEFFGSLLISVGFGTQGNVEYRTDVSVRIIPATSQSTATPTRTPPGEQ